MFGKNSDDKSKNSKNTSKVSYSSGQHNFIAAGTQLVGNATSEADFRIDGSFKGDLHCKAKVIIGVNGRLEGSIICENAVIEGHVEGTIEVNDHLNVKASAKVIGKVKTEKLSVESGSLFEATCTMEDPTMVQGRSAEQKNVKMERTSSSSDPKKASVA